MALFGYKNDVNEFKSLEKFREDIDNLLKLDKYISKKEYLYFYDENKDIYNKLTLMEKENVLSLWCKQNKTDYKKLIQLLNKYKNIDNAIKDHNDNFITDHLVKDKEYLDNVLKEDDPNIMLDEEQRKVVLSDEDYTLVIAGAGAGKTTTIEAKVKYLVDKENIDPSRILIVSFTKKATNELKDRFKKLKIPAKISTFHSIGNDIIKEDEEVRHQIVSNGFMFDTIKDYLTIKLDDEYFIKKILLFFASYLNMPFNEKDTSLLFKSFAQNNNSTLKSDLKETLDKYQREQTSKRRTLNDERVRSIDECRIANFLYINGIEYVYEPVYRYGFKDTIKPYCPDFLIKQNGREIYLEHFGISEDGKNSRFSQEELETYKKHVNDKIKLHKEHNTTLIYTFSKYNDGRDLISHLKDNLEKIGISFDTKSDLEIYKKIANNAEDKYFNKFIQLICTFIGRFKVNNFTASKFDERKISIKDERTKLFIEICYQCYLAYTRALKSENKIDFEDMINNASNILDKKIKEHDMLPFDYILVDEYQDISLQRFDLCEKLSKASNAKIIAVGDDWQSIFKFSGAKIDLFTKFEQNMGYANILKITKTYRNSQELIDIAGGFVMENKEQITKTLKSNKSIKDPVILMSYDDRFRNYDNENDKGPYYRLGEAVEKSIEQIVLSCGGDKPILLIGRYGFDGSNLRKLEEFFEYHDGKIKSKKYPNIKIDFLTAHSSKGLGYDNVIVINGKDDVLGFPSKIEDDPVMKLVIKDNEQIDFAEERRLFYVALTRTKNRVYIITPQTKPSKFILEIKDNFTNVILNGGKLNPSDNVKYKVVCPCCGYPLQKRKNSNFKFQNAIWICSNDPEICGFMTNDLHGGKMSISKCPDCEDGFLIVKPVENKQTGNTHYFLGCTNYKKDGTGCNGTMNIGTFTQDKEKLSVKFAGKNESIDNMIFCGLPIKELITNIYEIINKPKKAFNNFNISEKRVIDVLIGKDSKAITVFKLNELKAYNSVNQKYNKKLWVLMNELENEKIISINKEQYNAIKILKPKLNEEDVKILFLNIVEK